MPLLKRFNSILISNNLTAHAKNGTTLDTCLVNDREKHTLY